MNYLKTYCNLVNKRLDIPATKNIEKHHIIPRSLENNQAVLELFNDYQIGQLVKFSYRDHYIAHMLLVKIFENLGDDEAYRKMLKAWQRMSNDGNHTSWQYSIFRERWIRDCNSGENHHMYGKHHTEESIQKMKKTKSIQEAKLGNKLFIKTPEVRNKISNSLKGHEVSEETREKLRRINKENHIIPTVKPVKVLNIKTKKEHRFRTVKDCAKFLNCDRGRIKTFCDNEILYMDKYKVEWDLEVPKIMNRSDSWNKGKTIETDEKLKEIGKKISATKKEKFRTGELVSWHKGKKCPQLSGVNNPRARSVQLFDIDDNLIGEFGTITDCANYINSVEGTNYARSYISGFCNGKKDKPLRDKYIFKFKKESDK